MAAGPGGDYNIWTTGNAWVAAGMLRVWASFYWSSFKGDLTAEMGDLEGWTDEILGACAAYLVSCSLTRISSAWVSWSTLSIMLSRGGRLRTIGKAVFTEHGTCRPCRYPVFPQPPLGQVSDIRTYPR